MLMSERFLPILSETCEMNSQKFDDKQNFLIGPTHPKINEPRTGKRALIGKCF